MKRNFESCLYTPTGFTRELKPITNGDLQHLAVQIMNKTSSMAITNGNIEVHATELMSASCCEDFSLTETLYRTLIPINDNMHADFAEKACRLVGVDEGWEKVRNSVVRRVMQFDSTIKLWDATRRHHPLYQKLPHTIYYGENSLNYFNLRRLGVSTDIVAARKEFRNFIRTGKSQAFKPEAANVLENWNFQRNIRGRLYKAMTIASHVIPRAAINSKIISDLVRHSLKTELLEDLEKNTWSMGLMYNDEDRLFSDVIRRFQEPTEKMVPLSFTTTYKTSLYAECPKYIAPATIWDSEPVSGIITKDAAVEFAFVVRNLVTAWPRRFDRLHDFDHTIPIKDVLPENFDCSKVQVNRSDSKWAKIIRGDQEIPVEGSLDGDDWKGYRIFVEKKMDMKGLRPRRNAINMAE